MAINGQFFSLNKGPYPLSYSLKSNGDIIKKGIEEEDFCSLWEPLQLYFLDILIKTLIKTKQ